MECPVCLNSMWELPAIINETTGAKRRGYMCTKCDVKWEKIFICHSYPNHKWVYVEGIQLYKENSSAV